MKTTLGIKSAIRPIEVDDHSSETSIYVHSNIEEIKEVDPVFNTEVTVYKYDEVEYTLTEWAKFCNEILHREIEKTNFAIIETLELLELILAATDTEAAESSYINILYGNMIKKKLITIDRVPDRYRAGIEEYLK